MDGYDCRVAVVGAMVKSLFYKIKSFLQMYVPI